MKNHSSLIIFPILMLIGYLVALAGNQDGATLGGIPVFAIAVALAFIIQWLAFIPAYIFQTEKFFDITGGITYITVTGVAIFYTRYTLPLDARSILVGALVMVWAIRLGTFLFSRIRKAGKDDRFDELKPSFIRFLNVWTIQGLWVTFTAATALVTITSTTRKGLDAFAIVGALVWMIGFAIEIIADAQKSKFNADPSNKGRFILRRRAGHRVCAVGVGRCGGRNAGTGDRAGLVARDRLRAARVVRVRAAMPLDDRRGPARNRLLARAARDARLYCSHWPMPRRS